MGYCAEEHERDGGLERVTGVRGRRSERGNERDGRNRSLVCFDMGQIMFDTGDPCLVWLIARYIRVCILRVFVASTPPPSPTPELSIRVTSPRDGTSGLPWDNHNAGGGGGSFLVASSWIFRAKIIGVPIRAFTA